MRNVIIAGSSGMIGSLVLRACLDRVDVARVTTLVRRPSGTHHPKLQEVVHADLLDLGPIQDHFVDQDIAFFCVGAYTGTLPKEEFRKITTDVPIEFAKALHRKSPRAVFCFLSGGGADRSEKSRMQFARDKGAAENHLFKAGFGRVHSFRPGYIYPVVPRTEPNLSYRIMRALYKPLLSWLLPGASVTSVQLADAMVHVAFEGYAKEILENKDIQAVAQAGR